MTAAGLTPEIVGRVAEWLRKDLKSDHVAAIGNAFEHHAQAALALRRCTKAGDLALACAHEAAAMGCLVALVREASRRPGATTYLLEGDAANDGWRVSLGDRWTYQRDGSPTEAEALLAALESAP